MSNAAGVSCETRVNQFLISMSVSGLGLIHIEIAHLRSLSIAVRSAHSTGMWCVNMYSKRKRINTMYTPQTHIETIKINVTTEVSTVSLVDVHCIEKQRFSLVSSADSPTFTNILGSPWTSSCKILARFYVKVQTSGFQIIGTVPGVEPSAGVLC